MLSPLMRRHLINHYISAYFTMLLDILGQFYIPSYIIMLCNTQQILNYFNIWSYGHILSFCLVIWSQIFSCPVFIYSAVRFRSNGVIFLGQLSITLKISKMEQIGSHYLLNLLWLIEEETLGYLKMIQQILSRLPKEKF